MGGHNTQKSISFDLDTNALREYYCQKTGKRLYAGIFRHQKFYGTKRIYSQTGIRI